MPADIKTGAVEALANVDAKADVKTGAVEVLATMDGKVDNKTMVVEVLCDYHEAPAGRAFLVGIS